MSINELELRLQYNDWLERQPGPWQPPGDRIVQFCQQNNYGDDIYNSLIDDALRGMLGLATKDDLCGPAEETDPFKMMLNALRVIALDPAISGYLRSNDPNALKQVQ